MKENLFCKQRPGWDLPQLETSQNTSKYHLERKLRFVCLRRRMKTVGLLATHSPNSHPTSPAFLCTMTAIQTPDTLLSNRHSQFPSARPCVLQIYGQVPSPVSATSLVRYGREFEGIASVHLLCRERVLCSKLAASSSSLQLSLCSFKLWCMRSLHISSA